MAEIEAAALKDAQQDTAAAANRIEEYPEFERQFGLRRA